MNARWVAVMFILAVMWKAQKVDAWTKGFATMYKPWNPDQLACGAYDASAPAVSAFGSNLVAVLPANGKCGQCMEVKCDDSAPSFGAATYCDAEKKTVLVRIADTCPECEFNGANHPGLANCGPACMGVHIDLHTSVFTQISNGAVGVIGIQYQIVPCAEHFAAQLTVVLAGAEVFYQGFTVEGTDRELDHGELKCTGWDGFRRLKQAAYGQQGRWTYQLNGQTVTYPCTFKISAADGSEATCDVSTATEGGRFACGGWGGPAEAAAVAVPAPTDPPPTEPAPTDPPPTEPPAPTDPPPTEPAPTEPAPTEPAPTEPVPTEPAPTDPPPTEPAPTDPPLTEPAPTDPPPTEPAPTTMPTPTDAPPGVPAPTAVPAPSPSPFPAPTPVPENPEEKVCLCNDYPPPVEITNTIKIWTSVVVSCGQIADKGECGASYMFSDKVRGGSFCMKTCSRCSCDDASFQLDTNPISIDAESKSYGRRRLMVSRKQLQSIS